MALADLELYFSSKQLPRIKPFYTVDFRDDRQVIDWMKTTQKTLDNYYQPLFREQRNNLKIFLNIGINPNYFSPYVAAYARSGAVNLQPSDLYINEMYRLVMDQTSLVVSNELTAQVLPNNDDYKDKIAAKFTKMWLDSMSYDLDLDMQRIKWEIQKKIFGECFVVPTWDDEKGDLLPESKRYSKEDLPYLDADGKPVKDDKGKVVSLNKYLREGDIDLINPMPFETHIDPQESFSQSNWFSYVKYIDPTLLKARYGVDVKGSEGGRFDPVSGVTKDNSYDTKVWFFYHRSHPLLPMGRRIICTEDEMLENESLEQYPTLIDSQDLPLIRFVDLDVGVGSRGIPILFRNCNNIVQVYNKVTNQQANNLEAESPHIFVHQSAGVDAERMDGGITVWEWKGNIKPTIETPATNTSSIFKFREDLKKSILEMGMQTPMTRGDTPNAQLDSFIALQHFEDQRVQLASADIKGHIKAIENLYRMMMIIARDKMEPGDDRLIKIVGRNNKINLKYFTPENLARVYDVKITTTGNLANTKASRTQLIMTIKREFPDLMSNEIFVDMLGLSSSEKFMNAITAAVNSSEMENEDMFNGERVDAPERYEDLITHWDTHRIPLQYKEYKVAPPNIKMLFEMHMTATEKLMFEQAAESETFAARLSQLKQFPIFFSPAPNNMGEEEVDQMEQIAAPGMASPNASQEIIQSGSMGQPETMSPVDLQSSLQQQTAQPS